MRVYKFYSSDQTEILKFFVPSTADSVIVQLKNGNQRSLIRSMERKEAFSLYKKVRKVFFTETQLKNRLKIRKEIVDFLSEGIS